MAEEQGLFSFGDVVGAITAKLIRRHPHVFGPARDLTPAEVKALWDTIKSAEKAERRAARQAAGLPDEDGAFLAGVPATLPALVRAQKLTTKAAKVGFDWPDTAQVVDKIAEELREVAEAAAAATRIGSRTRSAISSSPSRTSPAITGSIRKRPCAARIASSRTASAPSRPA